MRNNSIKKYFIYGFFLILSFFIVERLFTFSNKKEMNNHNDRQTAQKDLKKTAEKVQVFMFHSTSRCYACINMAQMTKKVLEKEFKPELESGKIEFKEINIDKTENKELTKKFQATDSSLFINAIIAGKDNINQETKVWRLLSDEKNFSKYLTQTMSDLIKESDSVTQDEILKKEMTLYTKSDCRECGIIKEHLKNNNLNKYFVIKEKNVKNDPSASEQMAEDAMHCGIDVDSFKTPFLWIEEKCFVGEKNITNFLETKINEK